LDGATIGFHDPSLSVLLDAQHLAVARNLRSDRYFDGPIIGTAVDPAQPGEAA
jgi:hypothetical protein